MRRYEMEKKAAGLLSLFVGAAFSDVMPPVRRKQLLLLALMCRDNINAVSMRLLTDRTGLIGY
jgi:hypothetical protein